MPHRKSKSLALCVSVAHPVKEARVWIRGVGLGYRLIARSDSAEPHPERAEGRGAVVLSAVVLSNIEAVASPRGLRMLAQVAGREGGRTS